MMRPLIEHIKNSIKEYYPEHEVQGITARVIEEITGYSYPIALIQDNETSTDQYDRTEAIIKRLIQYEPLQYIFGKAEFLGLEFYVNQSTLIPRPETEELVEIIIDTYNKRTTTHQLDILDIGTGSGCIAISLAKYLNNARVHGWDISKDALQIAQKNANHNQVNIHFESIDVLNTLPIDDVKYDIIVSNPPYVTENERLEMEHNVLDYEPHSALFVPDDNALIFYNRITEIAKNKLKKDGTLFFEINRDKGDEMLQMISDKGFSNCVKYKDLSHNDRFIIAKF